MKERKTRPVAFAAGLVVLLLGFPFGWWAASPSVFFFLATALWKWPEYLFFRDR